MATYVILSRFAADAFDDPKEIQQLRQPSRLKSRAIVRL